jgi:thiol-disulfide isomerase/thioredoxin
MSTAYDLEKFDMELPALDSGSYNPLDYLKNSPLLLVFYKHDCPTCGYIMPFVQNLYERYGDDKARFFAIAQDNSPETREFAKKYGLSLTVLMDSLPYKFSRRFDFSVVPTIILVNGQGYEIQRFIGFQRAELEKLNYILASLDSGITPLFGKNYDVPEVKPG